MKTFTENELLIEVSKFYKGYLTINKALKLYEFEYGYKPEVKENDIFLNEKYIDSLNLPESVTTEALVYMKKLQETGVVNMFASIPYIEQNLLVTKKEAREILLFYMTHYNKIYHPENFL